MCAFTASILPLVCPGLSQGLIAQAVLRILPDIDLIQRSCCCAAMISAFLVPFCQNSNFFKVILILAWEYFGLRIYDIGRIM